MLRGRFGRHIREQNWIAVFLDLGVVVLGILVAFQIDRWREYGAERALEVTYMQRLIADIETDIPNIRFSISLAEQRLGYAELLMDAIREPAAATAEPARFLVSVKAAAFTNVPALATYTFEDLRSTGNLGLIRSREIKQALYAYYGFDQRSRQWMQLALASEQHYFELVAGVTDYEQERWVLENWSSKPAMDSARLLEIKLEPQPILAAVDRLRARQNVVDWLPDLRTMQRDALHENNRRLALAESLLQELQNYSSRISN